MRFIQSFNQFELDRIVYATSPTKKHAKRLETQLLNDKIVADPFDAPVVIPPVNSGVDTYTDLINMSCMIDGISEQDQAKLVERYDEDFHIDFERIVKEAGHFYPKQWLEELIDESSDIILHIKYKFNRPRPYQLAPVLGVELRYDDTNTAKTPSFPSGHSAQATLIAYVLSELYPELRQELYQVADQVAYSRYIGGLHFSTDLEYGRIIGDWLGERTRLKGLKETIVEQNQTIAGKFIKPNNLPNPTQVGQGEDARLLKIRQYKATMQDYKEYWDDRINQNRS